MASAVATTSTNTTTTTSVRGGGLGHYDLVTRWLEWQGVDQPFRVLIAGVCGSVAFNTALPGGASDTDYLAVYAPDMSKVVGLAPYARSLMSAEGDLKPKATGGIRPGSEQFSDCDMCVYDAGKYAELLMKGNPKVIEPLFAERTFEFEEAGTAFLLANRRAFLNKTTARQYISYAHNKLATHAKSASSKDLYHALRLASEATRIVNNQEPLVFMTGELREELMAIRRGEIQHTVVVPRVQDMLIKAEALLSSEATASMPESVSVEVLNEWLASVYNVKTISEFPPVTHELANLAKSKLTELGITGTVLYCGLSGSFAQGVMGETSTRDFIGVYAQTTKLAISLTPTPAILHFPLSGTPSTNNNYNSSLISKSGLVLVEAKAAAQLLACGSPRLLDALYFNDQDTAYHSDEWTALVNMRTTFLSPVAILHCANVASAQASVAVKTSNPKLLMIAMRLLLMAEHMVQQKAPILKDPATVASLLSIRNTTSAPAFSSICADIKTRAAACVTATHRMDKQSEKTRELSMKIRLDDWLLILRMGH
ncbi:hypothetical protein Pelo_15737 [Pelomyxa schiedti]|nr:hypothetical protein Pelo_15737 [Pelomyxa schiedti]